MQGLQPSQQVDSCGIDGLAVQVTVTHTLTRAQLSRWVREAAAVELGVPARTLA